MMSTVFLFVFENKCGISHALFFMAGFYLGGERCMLVLINQHINAILSSANLN